MLISVFKEGINMALIQCPECERNNVSDSAETCPDCGYGIKKHFEKIAKEQETKRIEEEKERLKVVEEQKKIEERETAINSVKMPDKPSFSIGSLVGAFVLFVFAGLFLWAGVAPPDPTKEPSVFLMLFGIVLGYVAFLVIKAGFKALKRKEELFNIALTDFEKYQKTYVEEQEELDFRRENLQQRIDEIKEQKELKNATPKCPICGSKSTTRISTAGRMVSVGTVGLASSKIGKQYRCMNCKHQW